MCFNYKCSRCKKTFKKKNYIIIKVGINIIKHIGVIIVYKNIIVVINKFEITYFFIIKWKKYLKERKN